MFSSFLFVAWLLYFHLSVQFITRKALRECILSPRQAESHTCTCTGACTHKNPTPPEKQCFCDINSVAFGNSFKIKCTSVKGNWSIKANIAAHQIPVEHPVGMEVMDPI